jgi:hypothetical protein
MKTMDKELAVPKWVLINRPKIYLVKLFAQEPKMFGISIKKRLRWASVVRE